MKLLKSTIDSDYMDFLINYFITLHNVCFGNECKRYSHVCSSISYTLDIYVNYKDYHIIPQSFNNADYYRVEKTGKFIPPGFCWISESGRFSCHDLSRVLGFKAYFLWDINRKVLLSLMFQNLEGIDENNGVLFCKTYPDDIHSWEKDSPLRVNFDWIEIPQEYQSLPEDYKNNNYFNPELREKVVTSELIYPEDKFNDIGNYIILTDFNVIVEEIISKLIHNTPDDESNMYNMFKHHPKRRGMFDDDYIFKNNEQQQIVGNIKNHSDDREQWEKEYISLLINKHHVNKKMYNKLMRWFFPPKADLPF